MSFHHSPRIVTDGLILCLDIANTKSFLRNIEVLVVAGGGAGRNHTTATATSTGGGGGGAGGLISTSVTNLTDSINNIVIGNGGVSNGDDITSKGEDSTAFNLITHGGGSGSSRVNVGTIGGSGGGGGYDYFTGYLGYVDQGNSGGNAYRSTGYSGGGGGGFSSIGENGIAYDGGNGGQGVNLSISGVSTGYAGGGGGAIGNVTGDFGTATHGGGAGGSRNAGGTNGTPNTGGGGGGAASITGGSGLGGNGGSGVVIVKYFGGVKATGGTVSTVNGYTIHTFTSSGNFTLVSVDLSGNNNDGEILGPVYDSNNEGSLVFNGSGAATGTPTGDYITIPQEVTRVQNYSDGVTYDIWINPDVNERRALLWGAGTIRHMEVYCGTSGGNFRTEASLQNGYSFGASAPTGGIPINIWTNITVVWAPHDTIRPVYWYKNGTLFYTHPNFYSGTGGESEDFYFTAIGRATGSASYSYAKSWSGKANYFKIYNKSLLQTEITQNFNALKGRFGL